MTNPEAGVTSRSYPFPGRDTSNPHISTISFYSSEEYTAGLAAQEIPGRASAGVHVAISAFVLLYGYPICRMVVL
jgi:hypothetical protein